MGVHGPDDEGHGRFHHSIDRHIAGMMVWRGSGGEWEWALVEAVLEAVGICLIRDYMQRHQATIA